MRDYEERGHTAVIMVVDGMLLYKLLSFYIILYQYVFLFLLTDQTHDLTVLIKVYHIIIQADSV